VLNFRSQASIGCPGRLINNPIMIEKRIDRVKKHVKGRLDSRGPINPIPSPIRVLTLAEPPAGNLLPRNFSVDSIQEMKRSATRIHNYVRAQDSGS
jgi:hypothetical protein